MKNQISARRQKQKVKSLLPSNVDVNNNFHVDKSLVELNSGTTNVTPEPMIDPFLSTYLVSIEQKIEVLSSKLDQLVNVSNLTRKNNLLELNALELKYSYRLKNEQVRQEKQFNQIHQQYEDILKKITQEYERNTHAVSEDLKKHNNQLCKTLVETNNSMVSHLTYLFKEELKLVKEKLTQSKEEENLERTISFQLGREFLNGIESVKNLVSLPHRLQHLREETLNRKIVKSEKTVQSVVGKPKLLAKVHFPDLNIQSRLGLDKWLKPEVVAETSQENDAVYATKGTSVQSVVQKNIKILSVISQSTFELMKKYTEINFLIQAHAVQIAHTKSNLVLIESCYNSVKNVWDYGLYSNNATFPLTQHLLNAVTGLKAKNIPIVFLDRTILKTFPHFSLIRDHADTIFTCSQDTFDLIRAHKNVVKVRNFFNEQVFNPTLNDIVFDKPITFIGEFESKFNFLDKAIQPYLKQLERLDGTVYKNQDVESEIYNDVTVINRDTMKSAVLADLIRESQVVFYTPDEHQDFVSEQLLSYLGCAKAVISTKNELIEKELQDFVTVVDSPAALESNFKSLMNDRWLRQRKAHLGYRYAMKKHNSSYFYKALKSNFTAQSDVIDEKLPLVSIVMATKREHFCDRIIRNLTRQSYGQMEILIMTQEWSTQGIEKLKLALVESGKFVKVVVDTNDTDMTLGERLNICAESASKHSQFIAKMDDDDFYFDHYLSDMLLPFEHGQYAMTGKCENFIYLEALGKLVLTRDSRGAYRTSEFVAGPTLVVKKKIFDQLGGFKSVNNGEDSDLIKRILGAGYKIFSTDSFNFVQFRSKNVTNHTWQAQAEIFEKSCTFVSNTIDESIVAV